MNDIINNDVINEVYKDQIDFDLVAELEKVYDKLGDDLTIEKLIECKNDIKIISDNCKKRKLFIDYKYKYDNFIKIVDEIEDKNQRLINTWNYIDSKLENAPTFLHFIGVIIFTIPVLDYVLDNY